MEIKKIEARLRKVAKKFKLTPVWSSDDRTGYDFRSITCPNGHMVGRVQVYRHCEDGSNATDVYFPCFKCGEEVHVKNY